MTALVYGQEPLTLEDIMKFRNINAPAISDSGDWLHYQIKPDRGDTEYIFRSTRNGGRYVVPHGQKGKVSAKANWGATMVTLPAARMEAMDKKARKKFKRNGSRFPWECGVFRKKCIGVTLCTFYERF